MVALAILLTSTVMPQFSIVAICAAVVVAMVSGMIAYLVVKNKLQAAGKQFMGAIMLGMLVKMAIGLTSVLIVALSFRPVVDEYVTVFFIGYFVFTAFEVYALMRNLRAENQGPSNEG